MLQFFIRASKYSSSSISSFLVQLFANGLSEFLTLVIQHHCPWWWWRHICLVHPCNSSASPDTSTPFFCWCSEFEGPYGKIPNLRFTEVISVGKASPGILWRHVDLCALCHTCYGHWIGMSTHHNRLWSLLLRQSTDTWDNMNFSIHGLGKVSHTCNEIFIKMLLLCIAFL